jgi:hypothetical protein
MSLLRFNVFRPAFLKAVPCFIILMSAIVFAGNAYSADVTLAWDAVSQPGVTVTGYRVYHGTNGSVYPTKGCDVATTSCKVSGLVDGQTYYFVATAYNGSGESAYSEPVSYTVPDALQTFTITASAGANGSISPAGTVSVTEGQSKTFTISPHSGFHVDGVLVDGEFKGTFATYTFNTVSANHTIYATFASTPVTQHTIVASDDGNGSISPKGNVTVNEGNNQNFTITPNPGYRIADVRVDGKSVGARSTYEFPNVTGSHTISASFAVNTFTITATAGSNGSITPGTVTVAQGSGQTFTITANSGYEITDVVVDNQSVGAVTSHTFSNIVADRTITAFFAAVPKTDSTEDNSSSATTTNPADTTDIPAPTGMNTDNTTGSATPAVTPRQEYVNQTPDAPELYLPANGTQEVSLTPLLEIVGFSDPDSDDDHDATHWQIAADESFDDLILDVVVDRSRKINYLVNFLVPHGTLHRDQLYYWRAAVKDDCENAKNWSNWSETFIFTTAAEVQSDKNANGVPDDKEPKYSDLDKDGVNDNEQPLIRVIKGGKGQSLIGIKAVEGVSRINYFTSIDPESIPEEYGPRPKLRHGLMVFNVTLEQVGATARIELFLPDKPHSKAEWYKHDPINGWYKFPVDSIDGKYFIEIEDGGFGDADGVANGIIVDPIGLAEMASEPESAPAPDQSGSACFIETTLDRSTVESASVGNRQTVVLGLICCGITLLWLAVAMCLTPKVREPFEVRFLF